MSVDLDSTFLSVNFQEHYQIIQCQGCRTFSFRKSNMDFGGVKGFGAPDELYPSRVAGRHKLEPTFFLPSDVSRIYQETHSAMCNGQSVLAGIGIRALIETVCKQKAAQGSNLEMRIDSLVAMGVLTRDGAEILHGLRILGNVAAHEVQPQSDQTLGTAMDVVEHLLKGVYILPKMAKNLPKRRTKKS